MKKVFSSLCLAGLAMLSAPVWAAECVDFQAIEHCPVGGASLAASDAGLVVSGLGTGGDDGVDSRLASTVFWNGLMEVPAGKNEILSLSATSGGESISELSIESEDGRVNLWANFGPGGDGSTYSVLIYQGGVLQGALGGLDGSDPAKRAARSPRVEKRAALKRPSSDFYVTAFPPDDLSHDWYWDLIFLITPGGGGGNWELQLMTSVTFALPDGRELIGDEIRFEEEVKSAAGYPYSGFDSIETRTSHSSLVILEEFAEGSH